MMARFNLEDYETVEERIKRFYAMHEDGRITTEVVTAGVDGKWLFKAYVYLTAGDQAAELPKATGYASETEGGPQTDWKAELGETSAIGRALSNMNLSGSKRSSREEMQKVERSDSRDFLAEAGKLTDIEKLRNLYAQAKAAGAPSEVLEQVKARAEELGASKQDTGTGRRVSGGSKRG